MLAIAHEELLSAENIFGAAPHNRPAIFCGLNALDLNPGAARYAAAGDGRRQTIDHIIAAGPGRLRQDAIRQSSHLAHAIQPIIHVTTHSIEAFGALRLMAKAADVVMPLGKKWRRIKINSVAARLCIRLLGRSVKKGDALFPFQRPGQGFPHVLADYSLIPAGQTQAQQVALA